MTTISEMSAAIRSTPGAVEMIAGGPQHVETIAQEWIDAGFTAADASTWWKAGGFRADDCAALRDAGLTADQCAVDHPDRESVSWAYAVCNGDSTVAKAVEALS